MYKDIGDALYNLIETNKATLGISKVYNYNVKEPEGYPFCKIIPGVQNEDIIDTADNRANINYKVGVMIQDKNIATSEGQLREIFDKIMTLLRENYRLAGKTLGASFNADWDYDNQIQNYRYFTIEITYIQLVQFKTGI